MVCARSNAQPSDAALRARIKDRMEREQANIYARHYLQDLRNSAFMDIRR